MNIKSFSEQTGLSRDTIRYYEKIGLLDAIHRNCSGHRSFSDKDVGWVAFIKRLKETGMPLDRIRTYALLRAQGDATLKARQDLLKEHAAALEQRIRAEMHHLDKLKDKIKWYDGVIGTQKNS